MATRLRSNIWRGVRIEGDRVSSWGGLMMMYWIIRVLKQDLRVFCFELMNGMVVSIDPWGKRLAPMVEVRRDWRGLQESQ